MKLQITTFLTIISLGLMAQSTADKEAIKAMCGCYSITFDYAETFAQDTNYKLHDQYHAKAPAEWIFVEEETEDKIVIQHLLVINDSIIVKHWRQDWIYENVDLFVFDQGKHWTFESLDAKEVTGQWTQKVFQVDDSPRYEGTASWVHVDGKHFWENTTDAPLPRREFSKRSDYNVMERGNRHLITDYGWLHEQDNKKIIRSDAGDQVLVEEKGLNVYTRIDESACQAGKDWWDKNKAYWALVRSEWDAVFTQHQDITIVPKIEDKMLWQALFELGSEQNQAAATNREAVRTEIAEVFEQFVRIGDDTSNLPK